LSLEFKVPSFTKHIIPCNREMAKELPLVSIVVVNFNDKEHLHRCLTSVMKSEYLSFEIILVDNGSTDGSVDSIKKAMNEQRDLMLSIICNKENIGPAAARNIGAKKSCGEYLAFLDNDTEVDSLWLKEAIELMEVDPTVGAIQCKLLLMNERDRFDYAGDYLSRYGFLVQRVNFREVDNGRLDQVAEIFGVKSAGMIVRRDVFDRIGGFDEGYFIYMEETDLCWRIWLNGYRVVFLPTSIVYHAFGDPAKFRFGHRRFLSKYHGTKNYISTLIKNLDVRNMLKTLPVHLILWVGIVFWHILRGRIVEATWIMKGMLWNLVRLKTVWKKRQKVQHKIRRVSDSHIMPRIMREAAFTYLYKKISRPSSGWRI